MTFFELRDDTGAPICDEPLLADGCFGCGVPFIVTRCDRPTTKPGLLWRLLGAKTPSHPGRHAALMWPPGVPPWEPGIRIWWTSPR